MPNLVSALRDEITRLARKECRQQIATLKSQSAGYRRDIAELKRINKDLDKRLAFIESQEQRRAKKPPPAKLAEGSRFSAKGLRSHRKKLGLSAEDYGLLVGLSGQTIYNYENERTKPRKAQVAKLVSVRDLGKREAAAKLALLRG